MVNKHNRPDYRYEKKFFINSLSRSEVELIVKMNSFGFNEVYEERFINNIYFDTPLLSSYFDNIEGNYNKKKTRIRWYGELLGQVNNSNLELKIKKGELGQKEIYPLKSFNLTIGCENNYLTNLLMNVEIGNDLKVKGLQPTLINRYKRKYFQSIDKDFRITLDTDLSYYSVLNKKISFLQKYHDDHNVILELKYNENMQKFANQISNSFPFRMTKSSKYVMGIERVLTKKQL
jgi:SPX domain protein involved in polyphosphate accumulation